MLMILFEMEIEQKNTVNKHKRKHGSNLYNHITDTDSWFSWKLSTFRLFYKVIEFVALLFSKQIYWPCGMYGTEASLFLTGPWYLL